MASSFDSDRYTITGTLTTTSALHVGSLHDLAVDRPVARDGAGRAIIPGTSLSGALREAWRQALPDPQLEVALWGGRPDPADSSKGEAVSRILIEDARLVEGQATTPMMVRTRTAIDDATGTAERGKLFSTEVMPPGQSFEFLATVDIFDGGPADESHVSQFVHLLRGGFAIGAGTTTGMGDVVLDDVVAHRRRRGDLDGLLALLSRAPGTSWTPSSEPGALAEPGRTIAIAWHPVGPVIIGDNSPGEAFDMVPLTVPGTHRCVHLAIPGTSVKGALRAHAERILTTIDGRPQPPDQHPAITRLFGSPPLRGTRSAHHRGRRGEVRVADVRSTLGWTLDSWTTLIGSPKLTAEQKKSDTPTRAPATEALHDLNRCECNAPDTWPEVVRRRSRDFTIGDHVAIDRWTGGAKDSALFTVLEPWLTDPWDWQPLTLHLSSELAGALADPKVPDADDADARIAVALLWLGLRELADGWVPLGHATTRGYGALRADGPGFELPEATREAWTTSHEGREDA